MAKENRREEKTYFISPIVNMETIKTFADNIGAELTVMDNGEHWFHTDEQMKFLDQWIVSFG